MRKKRLLAIIKTDKVNCLVGTFPKILDQFLIKNFKKAIN